MNVTINTDGTYSWTVPSGARVTSDVPPFEDRWRDRNLFGFLFQSYCLVARSIGSDIVTGLTGRKPKWAKAPARRPFVEKLEA